MTHRPLYPMSEAERVERLAREGLGPDLLPLNLTPTERQGLVEPIKAGLTTSEGKMTLVVLVIGTILEAVAVPLLKSLETSHPSWVWVPIVLVAAGAALQVLSLLGYQRTRTALKAAALNAGSPKP